MSLATIRSRIKTNISGDANFSAYEVYDYEPKNPHHPCVVVGWPDTYDPRADFAGNLDLVIPVRFELVWIDDEESDDTLMSAMDNAVAAIEDDRTLSANADDLSCAAFTDIGSRTLPDDTVVFQFVVPVEIMA